tara:strand:- start:428 stop:694 length:267 start_codon:yes stop_codon:yes gene_type:complete
VGKNNFFINFYHINIFNLLKLMVLVIYMKKNYNKIINQIQKIRSKNNVNWMNILKLAFDLDPKKASKIMRKINYDDKKISSLLNELSK